MSVKTYSLRIDGNKKLSDNFTVSEFKCKDGSDKVLIDTDLVDILQKVRTHFNKPVTINSAYRNATYNKKIGGASKSQHVYGTAADIVVKDTKPEDVAKYVEFLMPNKGGIGLYSTFTHVDVRVVRARWKNFGREVGVAGFPGYKEPTKTFTTANEIIEELVKRDIILDKNLWIKKCTPNSAAYWLAYKGANMTINKTTKTNLEKVNDIVWELSQRDIITNKDLWLKRLEQDTNEYWLARKSVNYIGKHFRNDIKFDSDRDNGLITPNDIIWELAERNIITNKQLWFTKLQEYGNAYWLAKKIANYVRFL